MSESVPDGKVQPELSIEVTTVQNAKLLGTALMEAFGYRSYIERGPYHGKQILGSKIHKASGSTIISPSHPVQQGVTGEIPNVIVNSISRIRLLPVFNAILETWIRNGDILEAWKASCEAAGSVNLGIADGDAPRKTCHCADPSTSAEMHPCMRCLVMTPCAAMENDYNQDRICSLCRRVESR